MARLAAEFEGVLDLDELRECGLNKEAVSRRARLGRLHRLHEGVYAVGHRNVSQLGLFIAAVKACRPDAALSHRANAANLNITEWNERDIEVTVPGRVTRAHPGIHVHRSSQMRRSDLMIRNGILVTDPTWTIVALASVLSIGELRSAVRQAFGLRLVSVRSILSLLDRLGPVRGSGALRQILAGGAIRTRSELEDVVLDLILAGGFEHPEVNEPLRCEGRVIVPDFRWPAEKLVVEADGARWHDDPISRADDLERQAILERHGETVLRIRWDEAIQRRAPAHARLEAAGAPRPK